MTAFGGFDVWTFGRDTLARMGSRSRIPRPTVKRLSFYLRELEGRLERGQHKISSKELGDALGLTAFGGGFAFGAAIVRRGGWDG